MRFLQEGRGELAVRLAGSQNLRLIIAREEAIGLALGGEAEGQEMLFKELAGRQPVPLRHGLGKGAEIADGAPHLGLGARCGRGLEHGCTGEEKRLQARCLIILIPAGQG